MKSFGINKLGINSLGAISKSLPSNWTPQKIETKILFWGRYSDISGGHMPNKVTGATDYLTVAGSAGSETYQVPNTTPYKNADSDFIWFRRSLTQRTTTTAELIGYDFTRSFILYDDANPYQIREIIILKSGETLTTDEMNNLRNYCHLSVWWDNTLSIFGTVKGNRGVFQNGWIIPHILLDGNNVGSYFFDEPSTITKDGSNRVSNWNDFIGGGHNLSQSNNTYKFIWAAGTGLYGDYGGYNMKSDAFSLVPPFTVYMIVTVTYWETGKKFFDGLNAEVLDIRNSTSTPNIDGGTAGYRSPLNADATLNAWHIIMVQFNTASDLSYLKVDANAKRVWQLPNGFDMGGITFGAKYNNTKNMQGYHKAALWRKAKDSDIESDVIYNWLKERYGL